MGHTADARAAQKQSMAGASGIRADARRPATPIKHAGKPVRADRRFSMFWAGCFFVLALVFGSVLAATQDASEPGVQVSEAEIAGYLAKGGLFHADADALDHRDLVDARLDHLADTPEMFVIADRSWQLVQQDLRWEQRVFGAYIDDLRPEDVDRIIRKLLASGRVPETILIGLRPEFLVQDPFVARLLTETVDSGADSALGVMRLSEWIRSGTGSGDHETPGPGVLPYHTRLDTFFPDGSVVWSPGRAQTAARTVGPSAAKANVVALANLLEARMDSSMVEIGEIVARAKSAGIDVILTMTPLHPEVYRGIHNTRTNVILNERVEDLLSMARSLDVTTLGSFEPYAAGCRSDSFAAIDVPAQNCLTRFLDAAFLVSRRRDRPGGDRISFARGTAAAFIPVAMPVSAREIQR